MFVSRALGFKFLGLIVPPIVCSNGCPVFQCLLLKRPRRRRPICCFGKNSGGWGTSPPVLRLPRGGQRRPRQSRAYCAPNWILVLCVYEKSYFHPCPYCGLLRMRACLSLDSRFRDVQTCRKGELKKVIKAIFSIRDKKAGVFLAPFFTDNVATARRQLALPANSEESFLGIYPEDYDVYNLGTWDDNSGQIEMKPVPDFCFCISELAKKKEVKVHDEKSESATA